MPDTAASPATHALIVFGPNLNRAGQAKGGMHVHAAGCGDCRHYGRGTKFGGEAGWPLTVETLDELVFEVYPPEDFGYEPESVGDYAGEFYVAPCVKAGWAA